MAIGIGMGFVALELAMLVAPAATRPAVTRYAAPAIIGVTTSAAMNAFAARVTASTRRAEAVAYRFEHCLLGVGEPASAGTMLLVEGGGCEADSCELCS